MNHRVLPITLFSRGGYSRRNVRTGDKAYLCVLQVAGQLRGRRKVEVQQWLPLIDSGGRRVRGSDFGAAAVLVRSTRVRA